MRVLKLGGSLARGSHLRPWLAALAEHGPGQVALVPGGGPFANVVRASQEVWNFPERAAHRMALLGMQQFGLMLCGLEPKLTEAPGVAAVKKTLAAGGIPVWLPNVEELDAAGVPSSWDITSDSLAAWLAGRVGAEELLLVKSCPVGEDATLESLVGDGIIDPALPDFLRCPLRVVAATESLGFAALLDR